MRRCNSTTKEETKKPDEIKSDEADVQPRASTAHSKSDAEVPKSDPDVSCLQQTTIDVPAIANGPEATDATSTKEEPTLDTGEIRESTPLSPKHECDDDDNTGATSAKGEPNIDRRNSQEHPVRQRMST